MKKTTQLLTGLALMLVAMLLVPNVSYGQSNGQIKAFPGAEGFGTNTTHGRGGQVIEVTNLNDNGPGSLRAAVETSGPRIIVFRTGGIIELREHIRIREPFVYIAGQTAPGDGITLSGGGFIVDAHDVVIRYMRVRPGDDRNGPNPQSRDGIAVASDDIYNVVIDHSSFSWGIDENVSTYGKLRDVTFSWNIISESLRFSIHPKGRHGMALLVGNNSKNISIHHNLLAHNDQRNPIITEGATADIVNNVIYNWGIAAIHTNNVDDTSEPPFYINVVGNYFKPGIDSKNVAELDLRDAENIDNGDSYSDSRAYVAGNIAPNRPNDSIDDWAITSDPSGRFRSSTPFDAEPVTTWPAEVAYERVLEGAGATLPTRDPIDTRVVNDVINGTGRLIDAVSDTPGLPAMRPGTPPVDSDSDGMPDAWETERGLNPNNADDNVEDRDGDGYTNIEEYINGLVDSPVSDLGVEPPAVVEVPAPVEPVVAPEVNRVMLVNADTNQDIQTLADGDVLDMTSLPANLGVRVDVTENIGSVMFDMNGVSSYRLENSAPYSLNGDTNGIPNAVAFNEGENTISATPYSNPGGSGVAGDTMTVRVMVEAPVSAQPAEPPQVVEQPQDIVEAPEAAPEIASFTLVDARTDEDIRTLNNGDTLTLADLPSELAIRANTAPQQVGSVVFDFNGDDNFRTENIAPYTVTGDDSGNYYKIDLSIGENTLTATPYTQRSGSGDAGQSVTVRFTVREAAPAPVQPPPVQVVTPEIASFTLVDARTNEDIRALNNGDTLTLADLPSELAIRANTAPQQVGSVVFDFNGDDNFRTENIAPYTVAGDDNPLDLRIGENTLTATPYTQRSGGGDAGQSVTVRFTVREAAPAPVQQPVQAVEPEIASFTLVNARTNRDIGTLSDGDTLILSDLPNRLAIRANTAPQQVGSVVFAFNGDDDLRTENTAPYALAGDRSGRYNRLTLGEGEHLLTATPYTQRDGNGDAGKALTIRFTVMQDAPATPQEETNPIASNDNLPQVVGFTLVDADTNQDIRPLNNGDALILSQLPSHLSIRANTVGTVGSVTFSYHDLPNFQNEDTAPYSIAGDDRGDYRPADIRLGQNILTAMPYTEPNSGGQSGQKLTIGFTVLQTPQVIQRPPAPQQQQPPQQQQVSNPAPQEPAPAMQVETVGAPDQQQQQEPAQQQQGNNPAPQQPAPQQPAPQQPAPQQPAPQQPAPQQPAPQQPSGGDLRVVSFTLINADNGQDIRTLNNGDTLDLSELPEKLNVRANVSGNVGSVIFEFTGDPGNRSEDSAPYMLAGDRDGKYNRIEDMDPGTHTAKATPYTEEDGNGNAGSSLSVTFNVVE